MTCAQSRPYHYEGAHSLSGVLGFVDRVVSPAVRVLVSREEVEEEAEEGGSRSDSTSFIAFMGPEHGEYEHKITVLPSA